MEVGMSTGKHWQQDLIDTVISLDRKLEDAKKELGKNEKVAAQYYDTVTKVKAAREAISGLAAVFNDDIY
jgi:hypothetical protein